MRLTLRAQGLDDLVIGETGGEMCLRWHDLGSPAPREVVEDAPDAYGQTDTTVLEGGRTITAVVQLDPWSFASERRLRAYTHPRIRATLLIELGGGAPMLQATVRGVPFGVDVDVEHFVSNVRHYTVQWFVPSGILESADLQTVEIAASGESEDGREYDLEFDRSYPPSAPVGEVVVTNIGDRDAYPMIQLHGPWSGATRVVNVDAGRELVIDNESVQAGDYLEIDARSKTIRLNGDPSNSRYDRLVFPDSEWWALAPGSQRLRFLPSTFSAPARMVVAWRHAYS